MVLSVNMNQLISTLFIDATYKTKFGAKDLKSLKEKRIAKGGPLKGIDFNSELVFFYDSWEGSFVKGLLFNLSSQEAFNKISLQQKNVVKASNKERGVLIYLDEDASQKTIDHYTDLAKDITSKKFIPESETPSDGIMNLSFKGNEFSYIQDMALNIKLKNEHLLISGTGEIDTILPLRKMYMIKEPSSKKYFEIQSGKLPDSVFQRVDELAQQLTIDLPEISSQQILIYGISVENDNGSPLILPKMDCILRFNGTIKLDSLFSNINKELTHIKLIDNYIEVGEVKYYYKQLSKNEIYIGVSESPDIQKVQTRILPLMKGFPSAVLDIEGEGIIARIINLMPQIKNTKLFLNGLEYYDIHSDFVDDHHLKIVGEVRLEKGKMMSIGLTDFILKFLK